MKAEKTVKGIALWPVSLAATAALIGILALTGPVEAQQGQAKAKAAPPKTERPRSAPNPVLVNAEVHSWKVADGIYMLVGPGGNSTVQVGESGVLVVDTQYDESADKLIAEIRKLSPKPIRYLINTSFDLDHTGGNEKLNRAGAPVVGGNLGQAAYQRGATIIAHENVLNRMSAPAGQEPPRPEESWPGTTYFEGQKEVYFNGEAVVIMPHKGHTDGDSIVWFRKSDVVSTGDVFVTTGYPVINLEAGGSINGEIDALNHVLDIAIPAHEQEGGTMIVPGHGRLCDEHDVLEYRDMVTIVRDRIQALIKKNMTLEQVKAANPTKEYDPRWGSNTGPWTTDMFVEAVYKSLRQQ